MVPLKYMLIDDDEDDREIFGIALAKTKRPFTLTTAAGGLEALEMLKGDETLVPDYIFLDLNMPAMHGTECLREIKKIPRLANVPVIIYSTSSNPLYEAETKNLKASHYLKKLHNVDLLSGIIHKLSTEKNLPFAL